MVVSTVEVESRNNYFSKSPRLFHLRDRRTAWCSSKQYGIITLFLAVQPDEAKNSTSLNTRKISHFLYHIQVMISESVERKTQNRQLWAITFALSQSKSYMRTNRADKYRIKAYLLYRNKITLRVMVKNDKSIRFKFTTYNGTIVNI